MQHDSTAHMIEDMQATLEVSKTRLAALLGVSERTLTDWRSKGLGDLNHRAARLRRLGEVVSELRKTAPELKPLAVLEDGRVPVVGDDEVDDMSLLSYVTAYPEDKGWRANVAHAMQDYRQYQQAMAKLRSPKHA